MGFRARVLVAIALVATDARADCDPRPGASTCMTSDALWPIPGPQRFAYVPSPELAPPGRFSVALVSTWQKKPIDLHVATPGPTGTDASAVDGQLDTTLATSFGIVDRLAVFVAVPATLYQTGGGASSATGGRTLAKSSLRDPRLGAGASIVEGVTAFLEAQIPTHSTADFAGEQGLVLAPTVAGDVHLGRVTLASSLGARIRTAPQTFFGETQGTQGIVGAGASLDLLPFLAMGVEAHALVGEGARSDVSQNRFGLQTSNPRTIVGGEWLGSFRTSLFSDSFSALAGGGGTLPGGGLVGIGRVRFVVGFAYTPGAATPEATAPPPAQAAGKRRPPAAAPPPPPLPGTCVTTCSPSDDDLAQRMTPLLDELHRCLVGVGAERIRPAVFVSGENTRLDLGGSEDLACAKSARLPPSTGKTARCELRCSD